MIGSRDCCALALLIGFSCTGCASMVSGRHAEVEVYSNVPGALVTVHDNKGEPVATTTTPGTIALRRQRGLLPPQGYTATIAAEGHQTEQFEIKQKLNPWVYGNAGLLQLGLIGWAVDNATGAVWQPDDKTYYRELTPLLAPEHGLQITAQSRKKKARLVDKQVRLASAEVYVSDDEE